jgi:MOSC domain-containing protein YiiM
MVTRLLSVQIGRPQIVEDTSPWTTAFFKNPVEGSIWLAETNLDGDAQADLAVHGGPDQAVCVYPASHYERWAEELPQADGGPGWFGENFSVGEQTESTVCIGDVYRVGTARVQVSQPRSPCWKLSRRWRLRDLPKRVVLTGRSGWYLRVLKPGWVAAGLAMTLESRSWPDWSIARVNELSYRLGPTDAEGDVNRRALAGCPDLADQWRAGLLQPA